MSLFTSHPKLRWGVPAAAVTVVALAAVIPSGADASAPLPPRTAEQLLVDVQNARLDGLSGTVVQTANLGLPDLSGLVSSGHGGGTSGSSDLTSLLTGSHTLRVWYSGEDKQRIALLGSLGESDIIHNGSDVWVWSSQDNTATHYTMTPPPDGDQPVPSPTAVPTTPGDAAAQALAAIDPTTRVSTDGSATIAGRSAYELVLTPRDSASLVAQVRIAVDAETRIPLRVQVFSTKIDDPALEVGFTQVDFSVPEDRQFEFKAPPGTTVTEGEPGPGHSPNQSPDQTAGQLPAPGASPSGEHPEPTVVGEGWTTVVVATMPTADPTDPASAPDPATAADDPAGPQQLAQLQGIIDQLPPVSGSWGSGRLLEGTLFSAVVTDDGRVAIGSVTPQRLYQALGSA